MKKIKAETCLSVSSAAMPETHIFVVLLAFRGMLWRKRPSRDEIGGKHFSCRLPLTGKPFCHHASQWAAYVAAKKLQNAQGLLIKRCAFVGTGMWPSSGSGWMRGAEVGPPRMDLTVPCRLWKPGKRLFWTAGTATLSTAATARRWDPAAALQPL